MICHEGVRVNLVHFSTNLFFFIEHFVQFLQLHCGIILLAGSA
jgi:hypothetical protein